MLQLTTDRLLLRPFAETDAESLASVAGDYRIADATISVPHPFTAEHAREWIDRNSAGFSDGSQHGFAIIDRENEHRLIGYAGLHHVDPEHLEAELTFWVSAEHEGRGIVTEAGRRIVAHAFDSLGINRLCAYHMVRNTGSRRVLEKLGFQQEGLLRQRVRKWGRFEDVLIWSRLRSSGADDPDVPDLHGQR